MTMYDDMAKSHPSLVRGRIWCTSCGATQTVDVAKCLRTGWPECCEETMSLDSPEERRG